MSLSGLKLPDGLWAVADLTVHHSTLLYGCVLLKEYYSVFIYRCDVPNPTTVIFLCISSAQCPNCYFLNKSTVARKDKVHHKSTRKYVCEISWGKEQLGHIAKHFLVRFLWKSVFICWHPRCKAVQNSLFCWKI